MSVDDPVIAEGSAAETDIAVVGMAGRFPGAPDVERLWERVVAGDDCLTDLERGADRRPDFVPRAGIIDGVDMFDHDFFGISRRDASVMDPQHRHFMECAWEALESAGHTPEGFAGAIGVFGGCGMNTYLLDNLLTNPELVDQLGWFLLRHTGNDKDFLTTTVSYRLGLRGPSVNVQTACSTSLVAVHLAVQSLLSFECDLALAGGVTIEFPHGRGYEFREGEILSPNGRCRAFDAASDGTVLTGGAAVVALRRLADAERDGDPVLAVVKGSAVNNDGNRKVGYLAPSVDGHADVVKEALAVAGVDPRSIGLLEAHGTGTAVGDPIEVAALTEAFRVATDDVGFCRLVSTKPNIGHLDTAAGTASLVKVVQSLRHGVLPPLANHTAPNPLLAIDRTPFVLSAEATPWRSAGPRRAGVSSLGVGGTNAHVIVEEAPHATPTPAASPGQVLLLSGATRQAVDDSAERLASFFEHHPDANPADVAHTLANGRRAMRHRRVIVVTDAERAPVELRNADRRRPPIAEAPTERPQVAFVFPGGGSQYPGMGADLDDRFEEFHRVRRDGIVAVSQLGGVDLGPLLARGGDAEALRQPTASLPAVFLTSTALARQWMAWGVEPDVMIGHSLGEYVAAHLAGVMSFEDALRLVVARSALMERAAAGGAAMLVVPLAENELLRRLPAELSLATVNTNDECVIAGPAATVAAFAEVLAADGIDATQIPLAAAAHSSMLDGVLDEFEAIVRTVRLEPPRRRYVSNVTGTWITNAQATDPHYWVDHLRHTVRFADGLRAAIGDTETLVVELGPGQTLASYARRSGLPVRTVSTLRHPDDPISDTNHTLGAFGQLWTHGVDIDLSPATGTGRRKLRLPTYPFQRERCWIEPGAGSALGSRTAAAGPSNDGQIAIERISDVERMGWLPTWVDAPPHPATPSGRTWVVVGSSEADRVAAELRRRGRTVVRQTRFHADDPALDGLGEHVGVLLAGSGNGYAAAASVWLDQAGDAVRWVTSCSDRPRFVALTTSAQAVDGPAANPADAMAAGASLVAPREYPGLEAAWIDVAAHAPFDVATVVDAVEHASGALVVETARCRVRGPMASAADPALPTDLPAVRHGGTYVVTGGLGGIGEVIATHLAERHAANLVILTTDDVPEGAERDRFLRRHGYDHPTSRRIRRVRRLEQLGVKVVVRRADVACADQVRQALDEAERMVGRIDGAIHAAGRLRDRPIALAEPGELRVVADPKAGAAFVFLAELERRGADLLVVVSSTSTLLAPAGQMSYVAANAVLDSMSGRHGGVRVVTFTSGVWSGVGMAAEAARRAHLGLPAGDTISHPVFSERGVDHHGNVVLSGQLHTGHHWVVADHRTASGVAVLPGTAHLALMSTAARSVDGTVTQLEDVTLLEPLIVPDDRAVTIRVVIGPDEGGGRRAIRIESDRGSGTDWTIHSDGSAVAAEARPGAIDPDAIARRCPLADGHPMARTSGRLVLGPMWGLPAEVRIGDGEAFGRIAGSEKADLDGGWVAHPAVLDLATGVAVALAPAAADRLYVPVSYGSVELVQPVTGECVVHAVRRTINQTEDVVADLIVAATDGSLLLRVEALQLRAVPVTALATAPVDDTDVNVPATCPRSVLDVAETLGLQPEEALHWFDRLVGSSADHLLVTSIDLDVLARLGEPETRTQAPAPARAQGNGSGDLEDRLLTMWAELLGVPEVAVDDDFFDLGGNSLMAIRLMTRLKREIGVRFELSTIFEASTVGTLAALIRHEHPDVDTASSADEAPSARGDREAVAQRRQLITISRHGHGRPFYVVHGAGGNVLFLSTLARALGGDRPIHGFQAMGVNEGELPDRSVEEMAARYVAELRAHAPGPYLLGGYSGGGIVALEMVRQLQRLGERVDHVVLFDSVPPGTVWPSKGVRCRRLIRRALTGDLGHVKAHITRTAKASLRRLVPERAERVQEHELQERALGYVEQESGFVNLYYYFSAAAERYHPDTYEVDATVLKADHVWPIHRDDYYWSDHITGRLEWRSVAGDHHSMFYAEHAPELAEVVREILSRVDA